MTTTFDWHVNFYDADRRSLGRHPLEIDPEPARQLLAFHEMRRTGELPPGSSSAAITPLWQKDRGEPVVSGISARCCDSRLMLNSECLAPAVSAKLKELAHSKLLDENSVTHYEILALRREVPSHPDDGIEAEVIDSAPPLEPGDIAELTASASLRDAEQAAEEDPPVIIPQRVISQMEKLTLDAGELETGGVLIGRLLRDAEAGRIAVQITALIPARETRATSANLTFTPETWSAVDAAISLRGSDEIVLGWAHSHPVFAWKDLCAKCPPEERAVCSLRKPFLSQEDLVLHRAVFYRAFMIALLASRDTAIETALFGWRGGLVRRRAYHVTGSEN